MATSSWLIVAVNLAVFSFILAVDVRGFKLGKWVSHIGTAAMLGVQFTVIVLLFIRPHHAVAPQAPFVLSLPPLTLLSLNLLTTISFTGLNGGEQVAVFAGEMQYTARSIGRSIWIAAPIIAVLYILSTDSLLSYVPAGSVDLAAPVSQTLSAALGRSPGTMWIASAGVTAIILLSIAQYTVIVAETSRLPMVAGWDGLVPGWFTRLNPRYRTPTRALSFVVLCCFALAMVSLIGAGRQEAFQLVTTAAQACYGLYYIVLFSIPLRGRTKLFPALGRLVQASAFSGLAVTLAAVVLQVMPIIDVPQPRIFAAKVGLALLGANVVGGMLYRRARRQ